jgi:O-antigen/teichoic acid export membrane protein
MSKRYSGSHFKRGLINFFFGKIVSAASGFAAMLLIVRALPIAEFASYSVLVSLVEVFTAISGLGLVHALLRYVPELYAKHYKIALQKFIISAITIRTIVLVLAIGIFNYWSPFFAHLIAHVEIDQFIIAFKLFLLVVLFRSTNNFISLILESTLHQGYAQLGYAIISIGRLTGVCFLLKSGSANLLNVILIEILSEGLGLLVMIGGMVHVIWYSQSDITDYPEDDSSWLNSKLKQIKRFALHGYLQHLAGLPFGSNTNRLVGGNLFSSPVMASFGFANSLYEYIKRYLPAQLLVGLIRPVVVARFSSGSDFLAAARTCNRVVLINITLIGGLFTGLLVGGQQFLTWISAGKYGIDALTILAMLLFVLTLETNRLILEMLVQTVERYELLIPTNILLSFSIVPAILLFPYLGAVGFPLINAFALLASNYWVERQLAGLNYIISHQWLETFKVVTLVLITISIGKLLIYFGLHWSLATIFTECLFLGLIWLAYGHVLKAFIADMMGREPQSAN